MSAVDPVPATHGRRAARSAQLEEELGRDPDAHRVLTGDRPDRPAAPRPLLRHPGEPGPPAGRSASTLLLLIADYQTIIDRDSPASLPARRRGAARRLPRRRHRPGPGDHLRALAGRGAQPAAAAVPEPGQRRRAVAQPDGQGRAGGRRPAQSMSGLMFTYPVHQAADILFCRATACRSARTSCRTSRSRGSSPAASTGATARTRLLPRAGGAAERRAGCCSAPTAQKMSKSRGNAIADRRDGRRDRRGSSARQDRRPAAHRVRPGRAGPEVSNLVLLARAVPRAHARGRRRPRSTTRGSARAQARSDRGDQRALPRRSAPGASSCSPTAGYLREVLRAGEPRARAIAERRPSPTSAELMHTDYARVR